jgi:hypothetical protein
MQHIWRLTGKKGSQCKYIGLYMGLIGFSLLLEKIWEINCVKVKIESLKLRLSVLKDFVLLIETNYNYI